MFGCPIRALVTVLGLGRDTLDPLSPLLWFRLPFLPLSPEVWFWFPFFLIVPFIVITLLFPFILVLLLLHLVNILFWYLVFLRFAFILLLLWVQFWMQHITLFLIMSLYFTTLAIPWEIVIFDSNMLLHNFTSMFPYSNCDSLGGIPEVDLPLPLLLHN